MEIQDEHGQAITGADVTLSVQWDQTDGFDFGTATGSAIASLLFFAEAAGAAAGLGGVNHMSESCFVSMPRRPLRCKACSGKPWEFFDAHIDRAQRSPRV